MTCYHNPKKIIDNINAGLKTVSLGKHQATGRQMVIELMLIMSTLLLMMSLYIAGPPRLLPSPFIFLYLG